MDFVVDIVFAWLPNTLFFPFFGRFCRFRRFIYRFTPRELALDIYTLRGFARESNIIP